jgi:gliding motility-associated-like protein
VIITDVNGCTGTQTVSVVSAGTVSVSVASTQTGCLVNDGTATATAGSGTLPYTYSWNNGASTSSTTGLAAGNYTVSVTDANGCTQSQTVTVTQTAGPNATLASTSTLINPGQSVTLTAGGGGTYQWNPSVGLSCTTCANPVTSPTVTTSYCVIVSDANGCTDSTCITVLVELPCGAIYLPNAFSPNNDLENDLECVMGACITEMHITIFNRWGELVFESNDQAVCWDGTYKGEPLGSAVFSYFLDATMKNGEKIMKKGNISLMR